MHKTVLGHSMGLAFALAAAASIPATPEANPNVPEHNPVRRLDVRRASDVPKPGKRRPVRLGAPKVGRNDPCKCGSGLKYKKCHGAQS